MVRVVRVNLDELIETAQVTGESLDELVRLARSTADSRADASSVNPVQRPKYIQSKLNP